MPGAEDLIGRQDELDRFDQILRAAEAGAPTVALMVGEAGVGKTTLVAELRRQATSRGFATATGACADGTADLPLAPLRAVLHGLQKEVGDPMRDLLAAHPDLASLVPGVGAPTGVRPDAGRVYPDLVAALGALSAIRPVLLVVEDLHWSDRTTVELLAFVTRNLTTERVALVLTIRGEDLDPSTRSGQVLSELHRLPLVERLQIRGLDRTDVASLAAQVLGEHPSRSVVDQLFERAGGNPFFTAELAASSVLEPGRLPASLLDVMQLRLGRLDPATARTVRVAAALDRPLSVTALAEVVAEDEVEVERAVRAAIEAGVLVQEGGSGDPDFRHALLREAAYDELLPTERRRIHKAAADFARQRGAAPAVVARHAERSGMPADALVAWLAAARAAAAGFAKVDAPPAYVRAVDLWADVPDAEAQAGTPWIDLLREAADASLAVGETDLGAGFAEQALAATDAATDPDAWVDVALTLSELRWEQGLMLDADVLLDDAEARLDVDVASSHLAWLLERRSFHALVRGEEDEALRLVREAIDTAIASEDLTFELYGLIGLGLILAVHGDPSAAVDVLLDARERADAAGMARPATRAMINLLVVQVAAGDVQGAVAEGEHGLTILARYSEVLPNQGTIYALLARALLQTGELARSEQVLREAPPVAGRLFQAYLAVARAELALARGRLDDATRALDGLAVELEANPYWAVQLSAVQAELELARGEPAAALHSAERLVDLAEVWSDTSALRLRATAMAAAPTVDPSRVAVHQAEARRRFGELVATVELLDAAAWMAQVEAVTTSDPAAAALAWARTADAFAESGHRWRSLSARAAEVAARRDAGDEGADALAEEVRSQAVALGATPLLTLLGDGPVPVAAEDGLYRFGDVVVDPAQFQVRRDGDPVHAEPQVLEVLVHLIANRDRVVTKDELFEAVWGGPFVGEAALSSRIRDVRRLVGDDGKAQHTIRTVHGRGYQFIAALDDGPGR